MSTTEFVAPSTPTAPPRDLDAYALEAALRHIIALGAATTARSRQVEIGASEAGDSCERRLAYRAVGAPPVNSADPVAAMVGTGVHSVLADVFTGLDRGSGRYLVETRVSYGGVPGTVDLYDRATRTVIDWKTSTLAKIAQVSKHGPSLRQMRQVQVYGAGLAARGEDVAAVALAFLPIDGKLTDLYVWRAALDPVMAETVVARVRALCNRDLMDPVRVDPADVKPTPSRLCPWCPWYQPTTVDLSLACNAKDAS